MPSSTYESLVEGEHPQPSDRNSLVAWEMRWEDYLAKMYTVPSRETARLATDDLRYNIYVLLRVLSSGAELQRLAGEAKTRELGWMQQNISRASLPLAELTWRALPLAKREEVVLLAIDRALQLEPEGFKLRRMMTPEVTMKKLAAADKDGGTFLALLRPIIARRSGVTIQEPIFTPNTVFDTICLVACVGDTTSMRFVNIHRAIALSHIVWNILCVTGIVKGGTTFGRHNRGSEIRDMFTQTRNATGGDDTVRVDKDLLKTSEYACSSCGTPESRLPPTQRMLRCSGCNVIGRTMVYCSRKCQREDWSEGRPTPHKQICGRASEKRNIPV